MREPIPVWILITIRSFFPNLAAATARPFTQAGKSSVWENFASVWEADESHLIYLLFDWHLPVAIMNNIRCQEDHWSKPIDTLDAALQKHTKIRNCSGLKRNKQPVFSIFFLMKHFLALCIVCHVSSWSSSSQVLAENNLHQGFADSKMTSQVRKLFYHAKHRVSKSRNEVGISIKWYTDH